MSMNCWCCGCCLILQVTLQFSRDIMYNSPPPPLSFLLKNPVDSSRFSISWSADAYGGHRCSCIVPRRGKLTGMDCKARRARTLSLSLQKMATYCVTHRRVPGIFMLHECWFVDPYCWSCLGYYVFWYPLYIYLSLSISLYSIKIYLCIYLLGKYGFQTKAKLWETSSRKTEGGAGLFPAFVLPTWYIKCKFYMYTYIVLHKHIYI